MLRLNEIRKVYKVASGDVHALKGINLEFRDNEFVCILGPSGCGKTTLLNIIGGLDHYTSGDLVIQGRSTRDYRDRDWDVYRNHRIGFIFQTYNLIPHQSVLGNVELALTIAGVDREERRRRATEALERVGLGAELNKRPNQLSGGQMQRVAIARALVNNPEILLADEPTGALDSETSVQIMELIKEISGERLVIMVTHNPELAYQYASRIVKLKDGLVVEDSMPYDSSVERSEQENAETSVRAESEEQTAGGDVIQSSGVENGLPEGPEVRTAEKKEKKPRARMSFLTSLALSARNLLTKKGRTILTSVAGSIGIVSVSLVLALSSGFNNYVRRTEEDMLSYYPLTISESAFDIASAMTSFTSPQDMPDLSQLDDQVYIDSFLTSLANGMATQNNISEEYLDYLQQMNPEWYAELMYSYGAAISDNLFLQAETFLEGDSTKTELTTRSLSNLKNKYITDLMAFASQYDSLVGYADYFLDVVNVMPGTSDNTNLGYGEYVLSQYDVIAGHFPQNENEVVLVVGSNNQVTDLTLAQLGLLEEDRFMDLFNLGTDDSESVTDPDADRVDFSDILGKEYTFFYNDQVYQENPNWVPPEEGQPPLSYLSGQYAFSYQGQRDNADFTAAEGEGLNLKISGILRLKDGLSYGCLSAGLNLTENTVRAYIEGNKDSKIVQWMNSDEAKYTYNNTDLYLLPVATENLTSGYTLYEVLPGTSVYIAQTPDVAIQTLGGSDSVSRIAIYATDFDSKENILAYLDQWNADHDGSDEERAQQITYTDTVGLLMGMVQQILDIITYVLVAFTAISLVVSSVMIGIITYVSVVERVKEIGVLRSLGARKQDVRNLFNAETFIIGLAAGLIGIGLAYFISIFINIAIQTLTGIAGIAALPVGTAFIMVLISVVLTLISGLIPAQSAAKKDPVIALRTE